MSHLLRMIVLSALVCWVASGGPVVAGVNLIQNGGFETGDLSSWTTSPLTGNETDAAATGFTNSGNYAALFRDQGQSGSITFSQTVATSVGEIYDIIFYASAVISQQNVPIPETVQVSFGGSIVTSPSNTVIPLSNTNYTEFVYYATATSVLSTLQFTFNFSGANGKESIFLDDVYVAVPEPASVTMTGMACVMGLAYAWKRRRPKSSTAPISA